MTVIYCVTGTMVLLGVYCVMGNNMAGVYCVMTGAYCVMEGWL